MRRFNPEKELRKIQHENKNKVIFGVIVLLLIIAIGSSYALYQIRYSKRIIYTKVGEFYQNDVALSVYIDGEKKIAPNSFPDKDSGKIFSHVTCKNGGTGYFDNIKWELNLKATEQDRCDVYFVTGNLPNSPELYQGMIPVTFSDTGIMYVADTSSDWYNYQDHRWGNAVLVDASNETIKNKYFKEDNSLREDIVGKEVPMEEVLQMYVWIPRYKYQLWNVNNESKPKQLINIKFENGTKSTGDITCKYINNNDGTITEDCTNKNTNDKVKNGEWYTHPAFTFGDTELKGIWVGKFEPSAPDDANGRKSNSVGDTITILPDKTSMVDKSVGTIFYAERNIELQNAEKYNLNATEIDTHMAKNSEWGAVAYLTQSVYGIYKDEDTCNIAGMTKDECEVWINNIAQGAALSGVTYDWGGTYTGCVGDTVSAGVIWNDDDGSPAKCTEGNRWNEKGVNASTTGNIYGIYDMVGGAWEYVMGVTVNKTDGGLYIANSGLQASDLSDAKYYDMYTFSDDFTAHARGHLADATRETLANFGKSPGGWNSDYTLFPGREAPWFVRGGRYGDDSQAGVFAFFWNAVGSRKVISFRSVLSAA